MSAIQIIDNQLNIQFDRFGIDTYQLFLKAKRLPEYHLSYDAESEAYTITAPARFASMLGVAIPERDVTAQPLAPWLFDDQAWIVREALDVKRFACWSDCGLGKTPIGLEWARQVSHLAGGGRVLIVTLNEIVPQWIDEARKFYGDTLPVVRLESRAAMREWCAHGTIGGAPSGAMIAVTNYEKFNHTDPADQIVNEMRLLAGVVLDESSRLKTGGGKQKWALIKSCKGIEYKLSLTATPAPNELMEFASQASFLERMRATSLQDAAQQIIWTYFTRDSKTHRWTIKKHARAAFFEWMSSWSIYVRDPRKYGWRLGTAAVPEPDYFHHDIPMTDEQRSLVMEINSDPKNVSEENVGTMFAGEMNAIAATKLSQAAKGFVYTKVAGQRVRPVESNKPAAVAKIIRDEAATGHQVLVWTVFDAESDILADRLEGLAGVEVLTGKTSEADRVAILDRFRRGETRVLISRAAMLGYGMNFQFVGAMVFSGWSFSYESFYQAVRRAYRHGQTRRVRVHIPVVRELEGQMWDAIGRKQTQHEEAVAEMEANYVRARRVIAGGKAVA